MANDPLHDRGLVHNRTLLGALDDHQGYLVHNRPWLAGERMEALERLAAAWLADGGENALPSLAAAPGWVVEYMEGLCDSDRLSLCGALEFFGWARSEGLIPPADACQPGRVLLPARRGRSQPSGDDRGPVPVLA